MSTQFKNRLVGVTILVACIIIFLPSLIDGKKEIYMDEFVAIPIQPKSKVHTLTHPEKIETQKVAKTENTVSDKTVIDDEEWQVEEVAETLTVQKQPATVKSVKEKQSVAKVKPEIKKQPVKAKKFTSHAWTIQLGAFKNKKNINGLLKRLKKSGFQAHTIPREVVDGKLTRIFVGPDISKKKLEKQIPQLKKLTKLKGRIVAFDPINP